MSTAVEEIITPPPELEMVEPTIETLMALFPSVTPILKPKKTRKRKTTSEEKIVIKTEEMEIKVNENETSFKDDEDQKENRSHDQTAESAGEGEDADSGVVTDENGQPPRKRMKKYCPKTTYCKMCKTDIRKKGQKSMGSRRHILQQHMKIALYKCSLCDYSSSYDKATVLIHIKKKHNGEGELISTPREETEEMEKFLLEACFGAGEDGEIVPSGDGDGNVPNLILKELEEAPKLEAEVPVIENQSVAGEMLIVPPALLLPLVPAIHEMVKQKGINETAKIFNSFLQVLCAMTTFNSS